MKYAKIYITPEDVEEKLKEKTDKTNVVFTNVNISNDGCVEIEFLVTDDVVENMAEDVCRQRAFKTNKIIY